VTLTDTPDGTKLTYQMEANVGGKIAQLGQRLLMSTTKKMADQFFQNLVSLAKRAAVIPAQATPRASPQPVEY